MTEFIVRFHSFRDIQDFVTLCSKQPFTVNVGSERYQVNATSLMGMFSLNCCKPLRVMAECVAAECPQFCQDIQRFLDV